MWALARTATLMWSESPCAVYFVSGWENLHYVKSYWDGHQQFLFEQQSLSYIWYRANHVRIIIKTSKQISEEESITNFFLAFLHNKHLTVSDLGVQMPSNVNEVYTLIRRSVGNFSKWTRCQLLHSEPAEAPTVILSIHQSFEIVLSVLLSLRTTDPSIILQHLYQKPPLRKCLTPAVMVVLL